MPDEIQRWAREVVTCALGQGDISTAERYITESFPESIDLNDCFIRIVFYVSVQDYEAAWSLLERLGESLCQRSRTLQIVRAVAMNRLRKHNESIHVIDSLLDETDDPDEIALLASYKINGLLHEELFEEAVRVYRNTRPRITTARGRGYDPRNTASCFMRTAPRITPKREEFLSRREEAIRSQEDHYGALTCTCNRGVVLAYEGRIEEARDIFEFVYKHIRVFGTQHIEEASTNYGVALLLSGQCKSCPETPNFLC